jgi:hypothetical protein
MESTAPIIFAVCFFVGTNRASMPGLVFLVLWEMHYIHRAYIYPFSIRGGDKPMPLAIVCMGFVFNAVNGYLNGRYIFTLSDGYPAVWLEDPRFIIGVILFISGFVINRHSDLILSSLRHPGQSGYQVANCGLFRWVRPNYLRNYDLTGWAIATWSLAGVYCVLTAAIWSPCAHHHLWYQRIFRLPT